MGVECEVRTVSHELRIDESPTLAYGQQRLLKVSADMILACCL